MSNLNQIKKPVITEKSTANAQFNKYVFEVDMKATFWKTFLKIMIERYLKLQSNQIKCFKNGCQPKVFKGVRGSRSETKRVTVTLKQGNTIDLGASVK